MSPPGGRRPWLAFLLSLLAPGLGHLYAGSLRGAGGALASSCALCALAVVLNVVPLGSALPLAAAGVLLVATPLGVGSHAALRARTGAPLLRGRWLRRGSYLAYAIAVSMALGEAVDWIRERVAQPLHVPSAAMFPTLQVGDHLYATRWKIGERQLKRGDVVIVELARSGEGIFPVDQRPDLPVDRYVERIVGLPGDVIEIRNGSLYIDAQRARLVPRGELVEPQAGLRVSIFEEGLGEKDHPIARIAGATGRDLEPFRVAPGRYFLLGDNRDNSYDSRYYGTVSRAHVVGIVTHLYFSLRPDGGVEWGRVGRIIR